MWDTGWTEGMGHGWEENFWVDVCGFLFCFVIVWFLKYECFEESKGKILIKWKACMQKRFTKHNLWNLVTACEGGKEEGEVKGDLL